MRTSQQIRPGKKEKQEQIPHKKKKKKVSLHVQEKLAVTVLVIMLALISLTVILYRIVDENNEEYTKVVLSQHSTYDSRVLPYRRGDIVDRNGTYLATSEKVYNLILDPRQIYAKKEAYLQPTVDALVSCFGYDRTEILKVLEENQNSQYIRYERRLPYDKKEAFETLAAETNQFNYDQGLADRIKGVWFEDEYRRVYPYNSLACNIIGFTSSDGSSGSNGIEQYYNDTLMGTNGREYGYLNDDSNMEANIKPAENGNTVVSTIDIYIQNMVEERIRQWKTEVGSKQIGVIVMNPQNGEILAMATDKSYDLNNPRDLSGSYTQAEIDRMTEEEKIEAWNQQWRNFCLSDTYEPGSPAKAFTVAAGLEEGIINANTHFVCNGYQTIAGRDVKCTAYLKGGHGDLQLDETLMVSCNDAMMQLASMEGKEIFKKYQDLFNFGSRTGIDLIGEADASTLVYRLGSMGPMDLATNSFGQNFNCTMIQMAAAFSSVINGGSYYEPHVVKQVLNENGSVVRKNDGILVRETVSYATSDIIRKALVRTVSEGTGGAAKVPGYEVGGKTGTAEKQPRGQKNYVVSFCGFAPAEEPQVLVYVVIDEPDVEEQAHSSFASNVFSQIMGDILPYLNIFPTQDVPVDETLQSQLPAQEGLTDNTGESEGEASGEGETQAPEKPPYETDEYIPMETGEDGLPVYVDILGEGTPASEGETGQPESSPPEESSQAETQ
ncbi:MAG: penicillin-binding protein 2 [Hungatella sp.]|nr:penicillin-binding protein 2 [Hungatella sp.]